MGSPPGAGGPLLGLRSPTYAGGSAPPGLAVGRPTVAAEKKGGPAWPQGQRRGGHLGAAGPGSPLGAGGPRLGPTSSAHAGRSAPPDCAVQRPAVAAEKRGAQPGPEASTQGPPHRRWAGLVVRRPAVAAGSGGPAGPGSRRLIGHLGSAVALAGEGWLAVRAQKPTGDTRPGGGRLAHVCSGDDN
ncbi:hypothetical protein SMALB_7242 [Streptomyces malaysiensis]|uniref:Uncharacterized protein n=1 Tax=Streptomyces malaysiensis TaxID=92644 RepID=A0A7X5X9U6_STRMQ|nr:hypothetical protein [Streptomyces malaysiensis]